MYVSIRYMYFIINNHTHPEGGQQSPIVAALPLQCIVVRLNGPDVIAHRAQLHVKHGQRLVHVIWCMKV